MPNRCELYKHYIGDHPNDNCPVEIDGKYVFQCEYCQKILSSLAAHYTHIKLTHKIRKSSHDIKVTNKQICPFCEKVLKSATDFIIHLVNDHPDKEPPKELKKLPRGFKCKDCDDTYIAPKDFYRHLKYNHEKIVNERHIYKSHNEGV